MTANQRRWLRRLVVLAVFVVVIVVFNHSFQKNAKSAQPPAPPSIPVVTAVAKKGDQPIYLTGLGTVTAFMTVTLRTRVDGELLKVAVHEGHVRHCHHARILTPGRGRCRRVHQTNRSVADVVEREDVHLAGCINAHDERSRIGAPAERGGKPGILRHGIDLEVVDHDLIKNAIDIHVAICAIFCAGIIELLPGDIAARLKVLSYCRRTMRNEAED